MTFKNTLSWWVSFAKLYCSWINNGSNVRSAEYIRLLKPYNELKNMFSTSLGIKMNFIYLKNALKNPSGFFPIVFLHIYEKFITIYNNINTDNIIITKDDIEDAKQIIYKFQIVLVLLKIESTLNDDTRNSLQKFKETYNLLVSNISRTPGINIPRYKPFEDAIEIFIHVLKNKSGQSNTNSPISPVINIKPSSIAPAPAPAPHIVDIFPEKFTKDIHDPSSQIYTDFNNFIIDSEAVDNVARMIQRNKEEISTKLINLIPIPNSNVIVEDTPLRAYIYESGATKVLIPGLSNDELNLQIFDQNPLEIEHWIKNKLTMKSMVFQCNEPSPARIIIYKLSLDYIGRGGHARGGHANSLIFDTTKKTISRKEPHGYDEAERIIDTELKRIFKKYLSEYTYVSMEDAMCPIDIQGNNGLCVTWSMYQGLLAALNPDVSANILHDYIINPDILNDYTIERTDEATYLHYQRRLNHILQFMFYIRLNPPNNLERFSSSLNIATVLYRIIKIIYGPKFENQDLVINTLKNMIENVPHTYYYLPETINIRDLTNMIFQNISISDELKFKNETIESLEIFQRVRQKLNEMNESKSNESNDKSRSRNTLIPAFQTDTCFLKYNINSVSGKCTTTSSDKNILEKSSECIPCNKNCINKKQFKCVSNRWVEKLNGGYKNIFFGCLQNI